EVELEGVARSDAPDPSGAGKGAVMTSFPQGLQFNQQLVELGRTQPHQPFKGPPPGFQLLKPQHP
ncbi:hypothetical protein, partial [Deinococcus soli (ex Cha et al. 2016)]|uniref:hypothetical protein n=1 Tax=Deinococcus soli (ex Cha et al. 2016) TaxID=1309411 RepID=UPI0039AFB152